MDLNRLGRGEQLAGAGAILLLIAILFLDWFSVNDAGADFGLSNGGFREFIFWVTAIAAIGLVVLKAAAQNINLPVAPSALLVVLGGFALLLVLIRVVDPPSSGVGGVEVDRSLGLWVALLGTALIAYGGWESMQAEGTTFSAQADRLQDRFGDDDGPGSSGAGGGAGTTGTGSAGGTTSGTTSDPGSTGGEGDDPQRGSGAPPA